MAKTEFLQIRMTPEDRKRLRRAASSEYIQVSTWARRAILQALAQWETDQARGRSHVSNQSEPSDKPAIRRVAEPKPSSRSSGRSR